MFDREMLFVEKFARVLKKQKAVRTLPLGVGIGEMRADVSQTRRAQKCIAERMGHYVAVGMSDGAFVERDFDAADDELAPFGEAVQVIADAAANAHAFFCSSWR